MNLIIIQQERHDFGWDDLIVLRESDTNRESIITNFKSLKHEGSYRIIERSEHVVEHFKTPNQKI